MAEATRKYDRLFPERFNLRLQSGLPRAIEAAASVNLMSASEYIRSSVIERLRADGIDTSQLAA